MGDGQFDPSLPEGERIPHAHECMCPWLYIALCICLYMYVCNISLYICLYMYIYNISFYMCLCVYTHNISLWICLCMYLHTYPDRHGEGPRALPCPPVILPCDFGIPGDYYREG